MRLRTRLAAALITVNAIAILVFGGVAISEVRKTRVDGVDRTLLSVIGQIRANPENPLAAASVAADQSPSAVALGFIADGADFTWLRDLSAASLLMPDAAARSQALRGPVDLPHGFRMAAVQSEDGATIVVVASLADINQQTEFDVLFLAAFWLILSVFMGVIIRILVRRDVQDMEQLVAVATRIAEGGQDVAIPQQASSAEVEELSRALRRMVDSLRTALITEQTANQRMQEFLGDASHELRTPLTVIKGYLELLEREVEPDQRQRALQRMRSEAQRMELLVNDLLFLAEIGSPTPESLERVELDQLLNVMLDDLHELQPERPMERRIAVGVGISAVPSHVHRAVGNAIANIRRHTAPADAVRVTLLSRDGAAHLVIEDAGPGLTDEMYERGIAHFQRFDRSRARSSGGSGLGMSTIAAVMLECGGSVNIGPSELGGLRLEYTFPASSE